MLTKERPFKAYQALTDLKYDLAESGVCLDRFHASEDKQAVRDKVFEIIATHLADVRIDTVLVEKCKTGPALQDVTQFYPRMLGYLLKYILNTSKLDQYKEVLVFTDTIPLERKRQAIQKAVKETLAKMLPANVKYRVFHHDSKSNFDLQIVDYCNWAIYRKHTNGDYRSYMKIIKAVRSEFDIFRRGTRHYY